MYLISQNLIYLILALLAGGGIGYAFRACLADTACDDVREDLALAQKRLEETQDQLTQARQVPKVDLPPFPQTETERAPLAPFVPEPLVTVTNGSPLLPTAPEMGGAQPSLNAFSSRDLETKLLAAAPGISPKSRFEAEDLTAIKGLTPAMDSYLAGLGITRLADIESLTPAELYWLVDNLPGDGASIYKDQWVAQASKLLGKS
jgi:predicted flap endonuclease-1-like 5' DNA nuclease